nr:hypothetical protein [Wolbachia endosymbiont of Atemnus politus]
MLVFAPNDDSYLRFQYPDIHTPTTVSWGVTNRTAAIRILNSGDKCRVNTAFLEQTLKKCLQQ